VCPRVGTDSDDGDRRPGRLESIDRSQGPAARARTCVQATHLSRVRTE
jgi:hypothetical protein